jgi:hypothetical protein
MKPASEKSVLHRQYKIEVGIGDSVLVIPNPFNGWPNVPDGDNLPDGLIEFSPAMAGVWEIDPGIDAGPPPEVGRFFISEQGDPSSDVDWGNDDNFQVNFIEIQNECFLHLTLWTPLHAADKILYTK